MSRTAASTNKQQEGGALSYWEKKQKNINRATIGSYDQSIETEKKKLCINNCWSFGSEMVLQMKGNRKQKQPGEKDEAEKERGSQREFNTGGYERWESIRGKEGD